jgi:hypothetical protein
MIKKSNFSFSVFIKYVQVDIKKCITWPKNMAKEGTLGTKHA